MDEWSLMCRRAYAHDIFLKPYAEAYLLALKRDGVKLAVATALDPEQYIPALENNGIIHLFDAFTSLKEVTRGKGFPDIYWLAAEQLEIEPPDCMVFEDILAGLPPQNRAGLKRVAFTMIPQPMSGIKSVKRRTKQSSSTALPVRIKRIPGFQGRLFYHNAIVLHSRFLYNGPIMF